MTYAGPFGLPQGGPQIIVRTGEIDLRAKSAGFERGRSDDREDVLGLLRNVVAIRKAGKKG